MFILILVGIFHLFSASAIYPFNISEVVDDIIANSNEFIRSSGLRNISLPDVHNGNWLVNRHFSSGSIQDLATIRRIDSAKMTTKSQGTMTQYSIEATVGLKSLEVEYQYHIQFLRIFETSGHMRIKVNSNSILTKTELVTDTRAGSCALLSKDVNVTLMDDIEVTILEGGFISDVLAKSVKYVLRLFLPNVIQVLNSELDEFTQNYPLSPKLTQYVCNYFI